MRRSARVDMYLDYAATAPLHPDAALAVQAGQALSGNPSSDHEAGRQAADALGDARLTIARFLGVTPGEVLLTSGGSEADTMALWGTFAARGFTGHLVTTAIEHSAVLENARALGDLGVAVSIVEPGPSGHVDAEQVAAAIRPETVLVSVMHANNETGAIQPVEEIGALVRRAGVALHTDAVHTAGKLDLAAIDASLIVGVRTQVRWPARYRGAGGPGRPSAVPADPRRSAGERPSGRHRKRGRRNGNGRRGSSLPRPDVDGLSPGYVRAPRPPDRWARRRRRGSSHCRGPGLEETVSLRFDGIRADTLADALDVHGIYVSTGSACHAGSDTVSHVLIAQGLAEQAARFDGPVLTGTRGVEWPISTGWCRSPPRPSTGSGAPPGWSGVILR